MVPLSSSTTFQVESKVPTILIRGNTSLEPRVLPTFLTTKRVERYWDCSRKPLLNVLCLRWAHQSPLGLPTLWCGMTFTTRLTPMEERKYHCINEQSIIWFLNNTRSFFFSLMQGSLWLSRPHLSYTCQGRSQG